MVGCYCENKQANEYTVQSFVSYVLHKLCLKLNCQSRAFVHIREYCFIFHAEKNEGLED